MSKDRPKKETECWEYWIRELLDEQFKEYEVGAYAVIEDFISEELEKAKTEAKIEVLEEVLEEYSLKVQPITTEEGDIVIGMTIIDVGDIEEVLFNLKKKIK